MTVHNQVIVVDVDIRDDALEDRLVRLLPEATQNRLAAFTHAGRRRQTLWGRLAALLIARERGLDLIETPPYPPVLCDARGRETALSIAHTGTRIAVGAADAEDPVMGLDIETLREVRSVSGMSEMAFGKDIGWAADIYDRTGDLEPFFLLWGMKESEIKLNRGGERYRLTRMTNADGRECRPEVLDLAAGKPLAVHARTLGSERLTVLTARKLPIFSRLDASDIARRLLGEH